jgi:lipopolysaccharide transport system permease protein
MEFDSAEALVVDAPPPAPAVPARRPFLTIKPETGWVPLDLGELWKFRDLMFALALRDIKLRYKQTALGVVWVVLQPLMMAGVLTFVFGMVANIKSGPVPYFVFLYAGQMSWNLFSSVLTKAGGSLVGNTNLISKVFFPRLILPCSSLPSSMLDFSIALCVLATLMGVYHIMPNWGALMLPLWIGLLMLYAIGAGLVVTSLMVSYRDVAYMLPLAMQILMYACPILYPVSKVPAKWLFWYNLNPISSIFEAINYSVFGTGTLDWLRIMYASIAGVVVLFIGVVSFKHMEQKFADVI